MVNSYHKAMECLNTERCPINRLWIIFNNKTQMNTNNKFQWMTKREMKKKLRELGSGLSPRSKVSLHAQGVAIQPLSPVPHWSSLEEATTRVQILASNTSMILMCLMLIARDGLSLKSAELLLLRGMVTPLFWLVLV